jgi:transposase
LETHTYQNTAEALGISIATLREWKNLLKTQGNLQRAPLCRKAKKLPEQPLRDYIAAHPDAFLHEIGAHFLCSGEAVRKACIRFKITLKKKRFVTRNGTKQNEPNMTSS